MATRNRVTLVNKKTGKKVTLVRKKKAEPRKSFRARKRIA